MSKKNPSLMLAVRLGVAAAFLLGVLGCECKALAEEQYPAHRIRIIVPYSAGGQTDLVARLIADGLTKRWGQSVTVENITGGGGNTGTMTVLRSASDGYTLLVTAPSFVTNSLMLKSAHWTTGEWSPVSVMVTAPFVLIARLGFNATTAKELVAQARLKANSVSYASAGVGTSSHLAVAQLEMLAGISMTHVPYRGAIPALNDILAGHVDIAIDALATTAPMWRAGKLKALGVGTRTRSPIMPGVPTVAESGVPGFEAATWTALVAPPSTPSAIVERISASVREILHEPEVIQRLQAIDVDLAAMNPADSTAFLAKETAQWREVIQRAAITLE
jgi:tripartite-type tricarboxylate transporter receptor subunit TctC